MYASSDEIKKMKKQNLRPSALSMKWKDSLKIEIEAHLPLLMGSIIGTGLQLVFNNKSDGKCPFPNSEHTKNAVFIQLSLENK